MPPREAQQVGEKVVSDNDDGKYTNNIPPTTVESEFWDIAKQEGSDV